MFPVCTHSVCLKTTIFFILTLLPAHAEKPEIQHGIRYHANIDINEYWISEKLDGMRGYWNGKELLSRSGNKIYVPKWFIKLWPDVALDGEIWSKRADFENIISCVKNQQDNNQCWQQLRFMIFDLPNNKLPFDQRVTAMKKVVTQVQSPYLAAIKQFRLTSISALNSTLQQVVEKGGEGLMLHHRNALYKQGKNNQLLKLKLAQDAEAKVLKHVAGKGKYTNMLGSLLVETPQGIQFKVGSGFSDKQRKHPPPVGSTITYRYIGKTKRGVPRFASFLRMREQF